MPSGTCQGYSVTWWAYCREWPFPGAGSPRHQAPWCHTDVLAVGVEAHQLSIPGHKLHARTQELAGPYDTVQEPQILGLREARAGGHERCKHNPNRNAFGSICCQSGLCCAHKVSEHMVVLAA